MLWQVRGTHSSHTLAVPAPAQTSLPVQAPQVKVPPQPSLTVPQLAPALTSVQLVAGAQQAPP
jgi:hypothetical protein